MENLACFKAYDMRGRLGEELNDDIAYRIGRAYGQLLQPKRVVVGGDVRLTSESLKQALAEGLLDSGADVIDLGMTGTEEIYFATFHLGVDGGVEVTASHNPMDYNGMKLVSAGAKPISGDSGLREIQRLAEENQFPPVVANKRGHLTQQSVLSAYIQHLLSYIDCSKLRPLKLVVNSGNGAAGHVVDALAEAFESLNVPIEFIRIHHEADGSFPNGIPNPLLPECRADTIAAVRLHNADMGIAWDGDFDRCFLFDEQGHFIEGYYIVGLLAQAFLLSNPGSKIIHDPRLTWNTQEIVLGAGGQPIQTKTGHAFIKERMRSEDAVYGGEMSAHHYFRDFAYCDSGMIPWLLVAQLLSVSGKKLSQLVAERIARYPSSGEINRQVQQPLLVLAAVQKRYESSAVVIEQIDGLSMEFEDWRFNLRCSNTEPVIRLNVETRANTELMRLKTQELLDLMANIDNGTGIA